MTGPSPASITVLTDLGPDTVELIKRDPVPGELDAWRRPQVVDRLLTRDRCAVHVADGTEELAGAIIAVLRARVMLPIDADTRGLTNLDAMRINGRVYELTSPGLVKTSLSGQESHVRAVGTWAGDVSLGEEVVIVPAGRRLDTGYFTDDGDPVPYIAKAVILGNATRRFGATGELVSADFTVILDLDAPIAEGDWIIVRGVECRVSVGRQESQWQERRELVVTAQHRAGA
jgi:hypothetical protein